MKYRDDMFEGYLDSEEQYWDYGTESIVGNNIIDTRHTGMSFYDQFFNKEDSRYLEEHKNLKAEIIRMTPEEYYEECAKYCWPGRYLTVQKLKDERARDVRTLEKLKNVILHYKRKLCIPMINYADPGQEGLHRMYVIGELYGWDFKVPVLKVTYADEDRARKAAEEKRKSDIDWKVEKAITASYRYEFRDKEELEDQLKYDLDRQFEFIDDVKIPDEIHLEETEEAFLLTIDKYQYPIDKKEIRWKEPEETLDDDIEDLIDESDLEDTEDFLKRYFGDDWREKYPHLKDTFNIKESYAHNLSTKTIRRDNENDISPYGHQVDFYKEGEKVGTCSVCGIKDNDAYMYDLMVFPEHRGKGYANDIMQYMIDKYDVLHLYVDKDNYKAINLYKKFGWNIVGEAPEQEGQKPGWEMGRFETDFIPNLTEDIQSKGNFGVGILTKEFLIIEPILTQVREEMVNKYGKDFLYGKCIEASDRIIELLSQKGIKASTVEGWIHYDYDEGCSDRPYDEHTWVETSSHLICDVTATQFNDFMEEDYPEIICQYKLPYGFSYSEPTLLESADELTSVGLGIKLRNEIEPAWTKDTCHPSYRFKWNPENSSIGQCAITAMYLNEKMGWNIYETLVGRTRHFFNKDTNGIIYDLTADQFTNIDIDYENCRLRDFKDLYRSCKNRYDLFKANLNGKEE